MLLYWIGVVAFFCLVLAYLACWAVVADPDHRYDRAGTGRVVSWWARAAGVLVPTSTVGLVVPISTVTLVSTTSGAIALGIVMLLLTGVSYVAALAIGYSRVPSRAHIVAFAPFVVGPFLGFALGQVFQLAGSLAIAVGSV